MARYPIALSLGLLLLLAAAAGAAAQTGASGTITGTAPLGDTGTVTASATAPVLAVDGPVLAFNGLVGETHQRTVTLRAADGAVSQLTLAPGDLVDGASGRVLPAEKVTVNPEDRAIFPEADGANLLPLKVTVAMADARPGAYTGAIAVNYAELNGGPPLTIPLTVTIHAPPAVAVDEKSQNLALTVETRWCDLPYTGIALCPPFVEPQGELPVYLVQRSAGMGIVEGAAVVRAHTDNGLVLPVGALTIANPELPVLQGPDAAPLRLAVNGTKLRAGAYDSTILVKVADQADAVEISSKINVRHNTLYALLVLLLSFGTAILFDSYNNRGVRNIRFVRRIEALDTRLDTALAPESQRLALQGRLNRLMDAVLDGAESADVTGELDKIATALTDAVEAERARLAPTLAAIRERHAAIANGALILAAQKRTYTLLSAVVAEGSITQAAVDAGLASADAVAAQTARLGAESKLLAELDQAYAGFEPDLKTALESAESLDAFLQALRANLLTRLTALERGPLTTARGEKRDALGASLTGLRRAIEEAEPEELFALRDATNDLQQAIADAQPVQEALPAGAANLPDPQALVFTGDEGAGSAIDKATLDGYAGRPAISRDRRWAGLKTRIHLLRTVVLVIAYIFALLVGWVTVYWSNPTFGAHPRDYLTLFLWGTAVNLLGAQSISLNTLVSRGPGLDPDPATDDAADDDAAAANPAAGQRP